MGSSTRSAAMWKAWAVVWLMGSTVFAAVAQICPGSENLGTLGGNGSQALAVSADGSVVVGYSVTTSLEFHAFRWTKDGGMEDLGVQGGSSSQANAVSADGSVVVGQVLSSGIEHAFRWTADGGMQNLTPTVQYISQASGVSADGSVVVGRIANAAGNYRAFRWTEAEGMQDLGTLGGPYAGAFGVSGDGSVVVGVSGTASNQQHAFRWTQADGMQSLAAVGQPLSEARAVSADGSVIVGYSRVGSENHVFRWTMDGGLQDLGTLGGSTAYAYGVSADGSVVVGESYPAGSFSHRAFYWTASRGMQQLSTLTPSGARAVSHHGAVIVGSGGGSVRAHRWGGGDSDGDGLLDCWETNGIDVNGDGMIDLNLPAMGALVNRKDIFVEIDAMVGRAPTEADLQGVVAAFDTAPVPAPPSGGTPGIALHPIIDETNIPLAPFPNDWDDFDPIKAARFGTLAEQKNPNWPNIKAARNWAFRYCIFADSKGPGSVSGLAEIQGNDFMVTLGRWTTPGGTPDEKAGTFMHELGHTLGLRHGGGDGTEWKPNYYSVMNYRWQVPQTAYAHLWPLDYSREAFPLLDENALDESVSLGATLPEYVGLQAPFTSAANTFEWAPMGVGFPVDWNGDQTTPAPLPVQADITRQYDTDVPGTLTTLPGFNDWANLRYALVGHEHFGDGHTETTNDEEFDLEDFEANEQIPPPPVSCAVDLNNDGQINFFDVQTYLNWYASGDLRADLIADGVINFFDVQSFLNAYSAGCP